MGVGVGVGVIYLNFDEKLYQIEARNNIKIWV